MFGTFSPSTKNIEHRCEDRRKNKKQKVKKTKNKTSKKWKKRARRESEGKTLSKQNISTAASDTNIMMWEEGEIRSATWKLNSFGRFERSQHVCALSHTIDGI